MKRPFVKLLAACGPIACAVYGILWIADLGGDMTSRHYEGLVAFVAIAVLSEIMAVDFRIGTGGFQPRSSMAFLPFLGCIAIFPPTVSVAAVGGVVAFSQLALLRYDLMRSLYNVSQAAISAGIAAATYHTIAPLGGTIALVAAAFFAALLFFAMNILLASIALSTLKGTGLLEMLGRVTGPGGSNLRYDILASPIAMVPVLLFESSPVLGIFVIVLPLLLLNYSYVTKQEVIEANKDLLRALVKAIETRDPYTSGHSVRVATLARAIAVDMGLKHTRLDNIEMAALLHDIGKIDPVYSEVLSKPYDLTDDERRLIQTHAARGAEILGGLRSVQQSVVLAVRHHHERHDGKGYPDGLAGDSIPLPARIIMLCDSIDAMLSDRPYRKALSVHDVHSELRRCAGTQFDPEIVRVVLLRDTLGRAVGLVRGEQPTNGSATTPFAVGQS